MKRKLLIIISAVIFCLALCGCRHSEAEVIYEPIYATGGPWDEPIYTIGTSRPEKIVIIEEFGGLE